MRRKGYVFIGGDEVIDNAFIVVIKTVRVNQMFLRARMAR